MPTHQHTWQCLREANGKLFCSEQAKSVSKPKKSYPARPIMFPHVKRFDELFSEYAPISQGKKPSWAHRPSAMPSLKIGPYVSIVEGGSFYARVRPEIGEEIGRHLAVGDDELYFKVIIHGRGRALVTVSYNKIISDRWLAFVDPKSIPKCGI